MINVGGGATATAAGTRARGGGVAVRGGDLATRGGISARGGTSGLKRTSNDPYRGSSSELVVASQAGARGTRRRGRGKRRRTATATATAGGRDPNRRANAIRELIRRGATPGERAAAQAAAQRLGL